MLSQPCFRRRFAANNGDWDKSAGNFHEIAQMAGE